MSVTFTIDRISDLTDFYEKYRGFLNFGENNGDVWFQIDTTFDGENLGDVDEFFNTLAMKMHRLTFEDVLSMGDVFLPNLPDVERYGVHSSVMDAYLIGYEDEIIEVLREKFRYVFPTCSPSCWYIIE